MTQTLCQGLTIYKLNDQRSEDQVYTCLPNNVSKKQNPQINT